jgi:hypothetical protein
MLYRIIMGTMLIVALCLNSNGIAANDVMKSTHEGKLVSITDDALVMTNKEGREHSHNFMSDVKLSLDGKPCKISDLKAGFRIRVTTEGASKILVTRIEAIDKNPDFANLSPH